MNVVCFGQQNWDVTWTEKQQHMTRLARRGHRVLYVDPDWSDAATSPRDRIRALAPISSGLGLREVGPGSLYVYRYHFAALLRWRLNVRRYPRVLQRLAARLHFASPVVVAFHPDALPLIRALRPRALVYYAVDEYTAYGGLSGEERRRIRALEEELLRQSDVALAVSPRLVERFARLQPRSYLLENGVDPEHFAPAWDPHSHAHPALAPLPAPRLGFVGQIDERLDQPLLLAMAHARPNWQIVLIGRIKPGVDVSRLAAEPNIHFVPFQPYEALPALLRALDVCLVPYQRTDLTQSCNPAKIFEYVAADRPVVSTPLEGIRACRDAIALAETPTGFIAAVEEALADPGALRERRLAVAEASAWERRTDALECRIEEALAAAAARRSSTSRSRSLPGRSLAARPDPPERLNDYSRRVRGPALYSAPLRGAFLLTRVAGWAYYGGRLAARLARGQRPAAVRRILVVRHDTHLGDLIALLPMLAALRERFPHARIVLALQPGFALGSLLEHSPEVDEVRTLDLLSAPSRFAQLRGLGKLFLEGFDVVVSGLGFFLRPEAFLSGAPHRIGLYDGHPLQRLNTQALPLDLTRHEAENNLALVELLTGRPESGRRVPRLHLDSAAVSEGATRLLENLGIPAGATILTVHVGSKKPSRRWPAERFAELVARLLTERPELRVVFTGTSAEAPLVEEVRARIPTPLRERAQSSAGRTDLPALVGLLERSAAVVSNDTGVMHLARTRGAPLVALLGPENDRRWGPHPWGPGPAVALRYEVPCARCARESCEALFCLRTLAVDEALTEVEAMLDAAGGGIRGPGCAADGALLPLARRVRRLSWKQLADAGFELPLVSVVVAPEEPAGVGAQLAMLQAQDYPHLEVLLLRRPLPARAARSGTQRPDGQLPVRTVRVAADDAAAAWQAALGAARGEILSLLSPGVSCSPGKVSAEVAALMREPEAGVARGRVLDAGGGIPRGAGTQSFAVRRRALAALLAAHGRNGVALPADEMDRWLTARLNGTTSAYADAPVTRLDPTPLNRKSREGCTANQSK